MSEERIQALEQEVTSLRAFVTALVTVLHEQRVSSVARTRLIVDLVKSGLPGIFPDGRTSNSCGLDAAISFVGTEPSESPVVRLAIETIHTAPYPDVVRELIKHHVKTHDSPVLGEHLTREVLKAIETDEDENARSGRAPRLPGCR